MSGDERADESCNMNQWWVNKRVSRQAEKGEGRKRNIRDGYLIANGQMMHLGFAA